MAFGEYYYEHASGWPVVCLVFAYHKKEEGSVFVVEDGIPTSLSRVITNHPRVLPLRPYWYGLVVDMAIFGAGAWLVLLWYSVRRAKKRKAKQRCVACGYTINKLEVCPECGASAN
jgi:hypothetical protein